MVSETILGYKCDIWQLGEDKIWIYNTVPLKFVNKSLGLVQIQEAKLAVLMWILKMINLNYQTFQ